MNGEIISGLRLSGDSKRYNENESRIKSPFVSEDEALKYLAKILVEAYFKQKEYERTTKSQ